MRLSYNQFVQNISCFYYLTYQHENYAHGGHCKYTYVAMKFTKRLQHVESVHEYNGRVDTKFCPGYHKQQQLTKCTSIRLKSYQSVVFH